MSVCMYVCAVLCCDQTDWVRYAAIHTMNVSPGPLRIVDWWMAYLNFQVIKPTMGCMYVCMYVCSLLMVTDYLTCRWSTTCSPRCRSSGQGKIEMISS